MRFTGSLFSHHNLKLSAGMVCLCLSWLPVCSVSVGGVLKADDPRLVYDGAWHREGAEFRTVYGGSQLKLLLHGRARLLMHAGSGHSLLLAVRNGQREEWRGIPPEAGLDLDSGSSTTCYSIVYVAARKGSGETKSGMRDPGEWQISGLRLDGDAELLPVPVQGDRPIVEFLGDSITSGDDICGRSGDPLIDADATATFAFLLVERINCSYRIRGIPGVGAYEVGDWLPQYKPGIPLLDNRPVDLVVINLGANKREDRDVRFVADTRRLVDKVRSRDHGVKTILMNFFRMTPDRMPDLVALAKEYPGDVYVFDARPYLVGYSDGSVHPNKESHRRLATSLEPFVQFVFGHVPGGIQVGKPVIAIATGQNGCHP